jgi:hypothetical protein
MRSGRREAPCTTGVRERVAYHHTAYHHTAYHHTAADNAPIPTRVLTFTLPAPFDLTSNHELCHHTDDVTGAACAL